MRVTYLYILIGLALLTPYATTFMIMKSAKETQVHLEEKITEQRYRLNNYEKSETRRQTMMNEHHRLFHSGAVHSFDSRYWDNEGHFVQPWTDHFTMGDRWGYDIDGNKVPEVWQWENWGSQFRPNDPKYEDDNIPETWSYSYGWVKEDLVDSMATWAERVSWFDDEDGRVDSTASWSVFSGDGLDLALFNYSPSVFEEIRANQHDQWTYTETVRANSSEFDLEGFLIIATTLFLCVFWIRFFWHW